MSHEVGILFESPHHHGTLSVKGETLKKAIDNLDKLFNSLMEHYPHINVFHIYDLKISLIRKP